MNALLLIDVQKGFHEPHWGLGSTEAAEKNIARLLNAYRKSGNVVVHVRHASRSLESPLHPTRDGFDYMDFAVPQAGEREFVKDVNSAFIGTGLHDYLQSISATGLTVCGFTTDHCVSTSVRMAGNLGYDVVLPRDACSTFQKTGIDGEVIDAERVHAVHLASLDGEFCRVSTTDSVLQDLRSLLLRM